MSDSRNISSTEVSRSVIIQENGMSGYTLRVEIEATISSIYQALVRDSRNVGVWFIHRPLVAQ